jgi:hypothetical protein
MSRSVVPTPKLLLPLLVWTLKLPDVLTIQEPGPFTSSRVLMPVASVANAPIWTDPVEVSVAPAAMLIVFAVALFV